MLSKSRASLTYVEQQAVAAYLLSYLLDSADEFGTEHKYINFCKVETILYLVGSISEIQRYSECACFEYTEVYRQPFKAVHKEYSDFIAFFYTSFEEKVCEAVSLFVKDLPCYLTAVVAHGIGLYELILLPCNAAYLCYLRVDLNESNVISVKFCISCK